MAHILQHLQTGVGLVAEGRVVGVQEQNGYRPSRIAKFRPVRVDSRTQGGRCRLILQDLWRGKKRDLLVLAFFLDCEILGMQPGHRFALLVGHDHIHQHQVRAYSDGRRRHIRRGRSLCLEATESGQHSGDGDIPAKPHAGQVGCHRHPPLHCAPKLMSFPGTWQEVQPARYSPASRSAAGLPNWSKARIPRGREMARNSSPELKPSFRSRLACSPHRMV